MPEQDQPREPVPLLRVRVDRTRAQGRYVALAGACSGMTGPRTPVYVSIGNSDDKLSQRRWHEFWVSVRNVVVREFAERVHGEWPSIGIGPYQNACICVEIDPADVVHCKASLSELAAEFGQDSIAWAEARTEFIRPAEA